jgi:16S rRNA (adenine1518-N6/adenine1519-N6)-dimethyltransferase
MDLWQAATTAVFPGIRWESMGIALPLLLFGVTLSQMALLRRHGVFLKKGLGQHILIDDNIADKIVDALDPDRKDGVFEIGPGLGALTQRLAARAGQVVAVEIDKRFADILASLAGEAGNVDIVNANILKVDPSEMVSRYPVRRWKLVGNLPFYITSAIIMKMVDARERFPEAVITVQEEFARRLVALPGSKDYSSLSICIQYRFKPEVLFTIKPTSFFPRPDVRSAVVRLRVYERPTLDVRDEGLFFQTIRAAFGQRRKTLKRSLRQIPGLTPKHMGELGRISGVGLDNRPEDLSIEEFAFLSNAIKSVVG